MWSIEDQGDSVYAIILTLGRNSRTVYVAYTSKDADALVEALETNELWKHGKPAEVPTRPGPTSKAAGKLDGARGLGKSSRRKPG